MYEKIQVLVLITFVGFSNSIKAQSFKEYCKAYEVTLSLRLNHYDTARYNYLIHRKQTTLTDDIAEIDFMGSKWALEQSITKIKSEGQFKVKLKLECIEGELSDASVSCDLEFNNWSDSNYVLMPAAVYNGNRYPAVQMGYMPFFNDPKQVGLDKPILLSDQPRLNWWKGYSRIQERSGSMSFPSISFYGKGDKGFWMFFKQGNEWGDYGIDLEEKAGREEAVISLTSPLVREQRMYDNTRMNSKPPYEKPANFKKGDIVTLEFYVDFFACPNVQGLYDRMVEIRENYYPYLHKKKLIPFSKAFEIQEEKFNKENWKDSSGYYSIGTYDNYFQDWQIGWTGGMMTTLPLLMKGDETTKKRVLRNFDWLAKNGVSPSGYYYGTIYKGTTQGDFPDKALGNDLTLTRKNADAVYFIFKQLDLMRKMGVTIKPDWEETNFKALEAQLDTWKKYGQLGQFINQKSGELYVGNTTSAGIFPAALCAAYNYSGKKEYLDYAEQIGMYYYTNFIQKGLTCGGPGDAVQSFDSESSYGLLESMVDLYEATGKQLWLDRAKEMAHQFATWVIAYDYVFPESTTFYKMKIQSTGAVFANTQNKHGAPGICTHSGIALLKLYRITQTRFYLKLLQQIAQSLPQFMTFGQHRFPECQDGWMSERCNITDYHPGLGETFPYSGWSETSFMLSTIELPGVYVNLDKEEVFSLDHIEAKIIKKKAKSLVLELSNTTPYKAVLKVLAEGSKTMSQPLFYNASLKWDEVQIQAGESIKLTLEK